MPKFKKKSHRAKVAQNRSNMRQKRESGSQTDAYMGTAKPLATGQASPLTSEKMSRRAYMGTAKPLATVQASPRKSEKMSGPNALGLALTGGRLSTLELGMPPSTGSPAWECTRGRVPWPVEDSLLSGLAGQSELVSKVPISIINDTSALRIKPRVNYESQYENNNEQNNELLENTNKHDSLQLPDANHELDYENMITNVSITTELQGIQGNFHQGNIMFGENAGSQCVANCLSAVSYLCLKDVDMWGPSDLDSILVTGDELYSFLRRNLAPTENYLLIHELPQELECYNTSFQYTFRESVPSLIEFGHSHSDLAAFNAFTLQEALQLSLMESHACFVCFGGNTMLIGKSCGKFFAFDSHSRSQRGMLDVNGKSSCVILETITDVLNHLTSLASSMGFRSNIVCEVTGVFCESTPVDEFSESNSEVKSHANAENTSQIIDLESSDDDQLDTDMKGEILVPVNASIDDTSSEVEFISSTSGTNNFIPFTAETKRTLCSSLNINHNITSAQTPVVRLNAGEPRHCMNITGDGNCFFRALSYSISQTEDNFRTIRQNLCHHIADHKQLFQTVLRSSYDNVDSYLEVSKMQQDGTWATEVEIFAAAHMLKADVYTYSQNRWIKYSGTSIDNSMTPRSESVYLSHINDNHYEVVLDVMTCDSRNQDNDDNEGCFRLSKERKRRKLVKTKQQVRRSMNKMKSTNKTKKSSSDSKWLYKDQYKQNQNFRAEVLKKRKQKYNENREGLKQKYQEDEAYRNKLRSASLRRYKDEKLQEYILKAEKQKYRDNIDYQNKKRDASKHKYKTDEKHRHLKKCANKQKYQDDEKHRVLKRQASKHKYKDDEKQRDLVKQASIHKYKDDEKHRDMVKQASIHKYKDDEKHRDMLKQASKHKYNNDEKHKALKKQVSINKYQSDEKHRVKVKQASMHKYKSDEKHRVKVKQASMHKYKSDEKHRVKVKQESIHKYKSDEKHRVKVKQESIHKYKSDEKHRVKVKQESIHKYKSDEKHRVKVKQESIHKYKSDEKHRVKVKQESIHKYKSDEKHRVKVKQESIHKYKSDEKHRVKVKQESIHKYKSDEKHRVKVKQESIHKYKSDEKHRVKVKQESIHKYKSDEKHRVKVKQESIHKYKSDEKHRVKVKQESIHKYKSDEKHRVKVKQESIHKYKSDEKHRVLVKQTSKLKYKADEKHRDMKKQASRKKYCEKVSKMSELKQNEQYLQESFKTKISMGPSYICCCCHRLLFVNQVQRCNKEKYINKPVEKCISDKYFHSTCNEKCPQNCTQNQLWICKTCHSKINNGVIPAEASVNNMSLEEIPKSLKNLNRLEQHLIARHIPFMKVMALPQGGQHSVHGPVVCVPSEIKKVSTLPRSENENLLLRVKLKRKITFKGHYEYSFVNTQHVMEALEFLKENKKWYSDLIIDNTWENTLSEETSNDNASNIDKELSSKEQDEVQQEKEVQFDTCLQPVDIGQEVLDHHFNEIYNLAPSEGKNPVRLLQEKGNEAKTFPAHFPSGVNTWNDERDNNITLSRYLNNRLMNADDRFAKDADYIFFSQYISELNQVIEKTQISLRKGNKESDSKVSNKMLKDPEVLKKLFREDEAFRFLRPIRGTPAYWQSAQKDLFAMLRQLGIPTWFCSFSAAEFRWTEIIQAILDIKRDERKPEDLNWTEKSEVLRSNPVTVARMIEHRFHVFLNDVILSSAEPIGKIVDYFYRVEFQQRGSPHMHCLFWVENAPKMATDSMNTICDFIDKYVTCEIPSEETDSELRHIVQEVQQHSKKHSKSCKKKGTECRFNFPRPPSSKTFISAPFEGDTEMEIDNKGESHQSKSLTKEEAKMILQKIWENISDENISFTSISELLDKLGISQDMYEEAHNLITEKQKIILKRNVDEVWSNQYNPQLLKCWNANMDIQYILDPFSCIVYVLSYISKSEREMGMLLKQTKLEAEEGNLNARETMKKVGSAYLNHREVSAQEAVYRVCNLKMKECSRKVVFVPVGENPTRLSKPLSQIQTTNKSADDESDENEDMWMTNIVDRYLARPANNMFENMCLATFCSDYRVLAKPQVPEKETEGVFKLQDNKGYIQKRTRTQPAVVRFPKFNIEKSPEKHFQSILQLFLPYRSDVQLKPPGYELYQTFYESGNVKLTRTDPLQAVKEIVDSNHKTYSSFENIIQDAQEAYELCGEPEDAWAMLCPETEVSRKECLLDKKESPDVDTDNNPILPDFEDSESTFANVMHLVQQNDLPRDQALQLIRTLNEKQRKLFYFVRDWALKVKEGQNPDPFHIFITGGAGTGKSHLIKTVNYEATRLLSHLCANPDDTTVLLTAFTGTAAFNIAGCTIHHAFSLNKYLPLPYEPLKEQTLNTLRAKLQNVKILVIDEVSMVYKKLLYYIHERLVQIKGDKRPFGGVSVIAVGDFYQLPPVKQRKDERLYKESGSYPIDFWNSLFEVLELDEIVRQSTDQPFARVLNTIRTRTSDNPLPKEAKQMLKQCLKDGDDDVLHVYSTNQEVNEFNIAMLQKQCSDLTEINAKDYQREKKSAKIKLRDEPFKQTKDDGLQSCLLLAVNARVMLTRNCDVADGLVNGVMGTVSDIIYNEKRTEIKGIEVTFDMENVGKHTGKKKDGGKNAVIIERVHDELSWKTAVNSVRHQFPLKLSWACTAHKVQGLTVDKIAVNLNNIFSAGQAYVALSRVTTLQGLSIEISDFSIIDKKIYADSEVRMSLDQMKEFRYSAETNEENICTIILHNVQSLKNNIRNILSENDILRSNAMCFIETWLQADNISSEIYIDNFHLHHVPRATSYNEEDEYFAKLKVSNGGGVCAYLKESSDFELFNCTLTNLEAIIIQSKQANICVATVYRPPSYNKSKFISKMQNVITYLKGKSETTIIMGDFNEDLRSHSCQIYNFFSNCGYKQLVDFSTTEGGTILDHVYCLNSDRVSVRTVPTFYSYHEAVEIRIKKF